MRIWKATKMAAGKILGEFLTLLSNLLILLAVVRLGTVVLGWIYQSPPWAYLLPVSILIAAILVGQRDSPHHTSNNFLMMSKAATADRDAPTTVSPQEWSDFFHAVDDEED
jgi:hypothetical protein